LSGDAVNEVDPEAVAGTDTESEGLLRDEDAASGGEDEAGKGAAKNSSKSAKEKVDITQEGQRNTTLMKQPRYYKTQRSKGDRRDKSIQRRRSTRDAHQTLS
jgi:hypothetical protein